MFKNRTHKRKIMTMYLKETKILMFKNHTQTKINNNSKCPKIKIPEHKDILRLNKINYKASNG